MPFTYSKNICNGLPTPSNIWMPIKDKITSASQSKLHTVYSIDSGYKKFGGAKDTVLFRKSYFG